jgi:hypothetical protein
MGKMRSVLPGHCVDIDQAKVNLVYQGCGLQGVSGIFPGHAPMGHAVQLVFDDRGQPL